MQTRIAIVILNWNGRKHLETFLPSVYASCCPGCEVIIADNASTDDSVEWLQLQFPAIKILQLPENYGFAKGYNQALKQIDAEYYVLLNSDVEVKAGWIEPVIALMDADSQVAACQPKLLQYSDRSCFEYAGAAGGWIDYLGYPFARGRLFDYCETDTGQYNDTAPIFWASGAALFIRAAVYHRMGGLDEYFFAHQEEIDLCWRLQLAGYKIMVCPRSEVFHLGGGTLPKGNTRKLYLNFRNNLIMLAKNLPAGQALWKIPFRFLLNFISALKPLAAGDAAYPGAVVKAHGAFLRWWLFHRKQSPFPEKRQTATLEGWCRRSIVWQHFVLKKTSFREIVAPKN